MGQHLGLTLNLPGPTVATNSEILVLPLDLVPCSVHSWYVSLTFVSLRRVLLPLCGSVAALEPHSCPCIHMLEPVTPHIEHTARSRLGNALLRVRARSAGPTNDNAESTLSSLLAGQHEEEGTCCSSSSTTGARRPRGAECGNCAHMLSRRRHARAHIIMREVSNRGEGSACLERWHG